MNEIQHCPEPEPRRHPRSETINHGGALKFAGVVIFGMFGALALATALVGVAMRAPQPAPAPAVLIQPAARPDGPGVLATSITPITSLVGAASGFPFSGESYEVLCTVAVDTVTLYPVVHNGTAWEGPSLQWGCTLDPAKSTKGTCIFPARSGGSLTWNAFKTGPGTVSACTALGRSGPMPGGMGPPSSGPGSGTVTSIDCLTGLTCTPDPIVATGTIAVTNPAPAPGAVGGWLYSDGSAWTRQGACASGTLFYGQGASAPICSTTTWPNTATTGDVLCATGANAYGACAPAAAGTILTSNGVGAQPTFQAPAAPTGSGAALTGVFAGLLSAGANTNIGAGTTVYLQSPAPGVAAQTQAVSLINAPAALVAARLTCRVVTACGGSDTIAFTVEVSTDHGGAYVAPANTLTCTITGAGQDCSDVVHTVALAIGDNLAISSTSSGGCGAFSAYCSLQLSK